VFGVGASVDLVLARYALSLIAELRQEDGSVGLRLPAWAALAYLIVGKTSAQHFVWTSLRQRLAMGGDPKRLHYQSV
jgi:hypothetical protein